MRRSFRFLIEIGVIYVIVSALLDFFLGDYPVLLWPTLAFIFALFGAMIFGALREASPEGRPTKPMLLDSGDELTRLQHLIQLSIERDDAAAGEVISERVRSLAFKGMAYHLKMPETLLRTMAQDEPSSLQATVADQAILFALTAVGTLVRRDHSQALERCLSRIEDLTN